MAIAKALKVSKLTLVDRQNSCHVKSASGISLDFQVANVESSDFAERFSCSQTIVTCISAFHEFDPIAALNHLMPILIYGGLLIVIDYNEVGWQYADRAVGTAEGPGLEHHLNDKHQLLRTGLGTDAGIKRFWMSDVDPNLPGKLDIQDMGGIYMVMYQARNWGEVK
ncbi:MAG: hypothetical protein AAGA46_09635, partial [Cyanobacteria bacterium P01_F01_bin.13]